MITDISKMRCLKNFIPLRVINVQKQGKPSDLYKIVQDENQTIGSFMFSDSGHISCLEIESQFRRKKTGANALLTLYNFVMQKAREKGIDCIHFIGLKNNPNNVVRMYGKIAYSFSDYDIVSHLIPVNKNGEETVKCFAMPIEVAKDEIDKIVSIVKFVDKTSKNIII